MPPLRPRTFERKLRLLMVTTAVTALLTASLGYGAGHFLLLRATAQTMEVDRSAAWFAVTALSALLVSMLLAAVVAARLQRVVSRPVGRLLDAVRRASREKDYGVRVERESDDELGELVDGINELLVQIQRQDTERTQQAEALARSNADLDDFVSIASHDLKEPLRGLHNHALFLLEDYAEKLDDAGKERLETLVRLTKGMEKLLNTLHHYSRIGRGESAVGATDLDGVLHEVLDTLGPRLEERGIEVRIPRPLPVVVCDQARIGEVFRNLLTNAIKYSDAERKWIEVAWRDGAEPAAGAHVAVAGPVVADHPAFSVRDNGIGIREQHLESVFQIFRRLHARDRYGGGTGAGLSIVQKIVEQHEGRLWIESTWGEGTAFHFSVGALADEKPASG